MLIICGSLKILFIGRGHEKLIYKRGGLDSLRFNEGGLGKKEGGGCF